MWTREELKMRGKAAMKRNYGSCVVVALTMGIISSLSGSSGGGSAGGAADIANTYFHPTISMALATVTITIAIVGMVLKIFVESNLKVGGAKFFILNQMGMQPEFGTILDGFKSGKYANIVLIMFLKELFIALWTMLFIVPGVMKSYEYYMVPYILAENPGMDSKSAFAISKRMMDGEKWDTFVLEISFIGWQILSLFTIGILGVAYVSPYLEATRAELYAYCKEKGYQQGFIR